MPMENRIHIVEKQDRFIRIQEGEYDGVGPADDAAVKDGPIGKQHFAVALLAPPDQARAADQFGLRTDIEQGRVVKKRERVAIELDVREVGQQHVPIDGIIR